jgi:hypothetical protein
MQQQETEDNQDHASPQQEQQEPATTLQEDNMAMNLSILLLPAPMKALSACTEKHTSKMGLTNAKTVLLVRFYLTNPFLNLSYKILCKEFGEILRDSQLLKQKGDHST